MKQMKQTKQLLILTGLTVCLFACQTDGEDAGFLVDRVTPVKAEFKYLADPEARFAVEYAGVEVDNSLPFTNEIGMIRYESKKTAYIKENSMSNLLQVYRFENDERIIDMEAQVDVPAVSTGFTIPLVQLAAGSPVQVLNMPEAATDSNSIAVQFFYADPSQPEEVKLTILAVNRPSLDDAFNRLNNVPANAKDTMETITLRRSELNEPVILNPNLFKDSNSGLAARFFYKVSDLDGGILQNYPNDVGNNPPEIKIITRQTINFTSYSEYKSAIMRFGYKSAAEVFASPVTLLNGEKW
jgi:hypothetical protein